MKYKIIKYGAVWCGPCRITDQQLREMDIPFENVDIEKETDRAVKRKITGIPFFEVVNLSNDAIEWTHVGTLSADELKLLVDYSHE